MSSGKYYDFAPLLSHNPLIAMSIGGRGIGKSFGAKKLAINDYIRGGWHFMYVRRFKDEIRKASQHFFDDIVEHFPDYMFRMQGYNAQIALRNDKGKASWQTFGYFVALSTVQQLKSVPFPKVKRIIFDEFIAEIGAARELPEEHNVIMNLLNTVDRHQDKTQLIMLANAVSIMSPHLLAYDIVPDSKIRTYADGLVAVDFPSSEAYNAATAHTRTARLFAQHDDYNAYATLNQFADNAPTLIDTKPSSAKYRWSIELSKGTFSVWRDDDTDNYYVQVKRPKAERVLTTLATKMSEDKTFVTFSDLPMQFMRTAFRHGRMWFDTPTTRNAMAEIFKR